MAVIVLEQNSGVVECISNPTDVEIVLHDFDIQDTDNPNFEYGQQDGDDYCVIHFPPEQSGTPAEDRHGREPDKVKPLAQYLTEYLATGINRTHEAGMPVDYTEEGLKPVLEQALDAYESTENVKIKIERV